MSEKDKVTEERLSRLSKKAVEVFGIDEAAVVWLSSPQRGLGGGIPTDYATTESRVQDVENLLGRIEHSVYS